MVTDQMIERARNAGRDLTIPLRDYVRDLRRRASDAEWSGDTTTARNLEREADRAIKDGKIPSCCFEER